MCGGFPIDRNGLPVGKQVIKNIDDILPCGSIGAETVNQVKQPKDISPNHRENVLLTFDLKSEPNEARLTAIRINGDEMQFKSFAGFEAIDIYNLLFGDEES